MKIFFLFAIIFAILMVVSGQDNCACTREFAPVCGVSGITYANICRMNCAGDLLGHTGKC